MSGNQFFVSPTGSPAGDGTAEHPWDLKTALAQPAAVKPGDTIWLTQGRYSGCFVSELTGTADAPITLRQYPGERATIEGVSCIPAGSVHSNPSFDIKGAYANYWGFEVTSQNGTATPSDQMGVSVEAPYTKCINLVSHDNGGNGFGSWSSAPDSEIYGSLTYYNGRQSNDSARGHGLYAQNETGTKLFQDNFIFKGYGFGLHLYGEGGALKGFHIDGNVAFHSSPSYPNNILIGGALPAQDIDLSNNMVYVAKMGDESSNSMRLGLWQSTTNENVTLTGNYLVGSITFMPWRSITMNSNAVVTNVAEAVYINPPSDGVWSGSGGSNHYYSTNTYPPPLAIDYKGYDLADWQALTGMDTGSTLNTASLPTANKIFIRPNKYEPGRANIVIFNWEQDASVSVDISAAGLNAGQGFVIKDVQNFFGPAVVSGTYTGAPVSIPVVGTDGAVAAPAPAEGSSDIATHTDSKFGAFVLLPR